MSGKIKKVLILLVLLFPSLTLSMFFVDDSINQNKNNLDDNDKIEIIENPRQPKKSSSWNVDFIHIQNDNWSATVLNWIILRAGTEEEPHIIENATINKAGREIGILIENCSDHFELRNCTVFNCGTEEDTYQQAGIMLLNTSNGKIINNNCSFNKKNGIVLLGKCENNTIFNNTIKYNELDGITLMGDYSDPCKFNNISGNIINNNGYGIYMFYSNNTTISNNTINYNLGTGIGLESIGFDYCDYLNITNNIINGNGYGPDREVIDGIRIFNAKYCNIINNTINHNKGIGILIHSEASTISNNTIKNNNDYGIYFSGQNSEVSFNRLTNCGIGIGFGPYYTETNIIDKTNKINEKDFYYYSNKNGLNNDNFTDPGQIILYNCNKSLINSLTITNTSDAIYLYNCNNSIIKNDNLHNNTKSALVVYGGRNNTIELNNMYNNAIGVNLRWTNNITLKNNDMKNCGLNVYTAFFETIKLNIDTTNKVNNKPVYCYINTTGLDHNKFSNAGQVLMFYCNNSILRDLNVSLGTTGILLMYCLNITLFNITSNFNKLSGMFVDYCWYVNITESFFEYNKETGIDGDGCVYSNIKNNSINYNDYYGISVDSSFSCNNVTDNIISFNEWDGIEFDHGDYNNFVGNTINNNTGRGISIGHSYYNNIIDNIIKNNLETGIIINDCDYINITENYIENNKEAGIKLIAYIPWPLTGNIIHNNTIIKNENGIIIDNCNNTRIEANFIVNNLFNGIELINSNYTEIKTNAIINCTNIGIYITSNDSEYNSIYNNTFINNYFHAIENGFNNFWNSSSIGNYWDNYVGSDSNSDGIGEQSFYIDDGEGEGIDKMPIWDGIKPNLKIILPINESDHSDAPNFNIIISDEVSDTVWYHHNVDPIIQIDKMWYILNSSTSKIYFINNETINPELWNDFSNGTMIITFYVNDTCGNVNYTTITVFKTSLKPSPTSTTPSDDDDDNDDGNGDEFDIIKFLTSPSGMAIIGGSIAAIGIVIIFKIKGSGKKRLKEIERIKKIRYK